MTKRKDGWQNLVSMLGTQYDKKTKLGFKFPGRLTQVTLNSIYRGDGFARKIVDLPIFHMLREWFKIEGDTDGEYQKIYKEIKLKTYLKKHLTWDALHGGAGLLIGVDDGGELHEPVNWNRIKSIQFFKAYDRWNVQTHHEYRDVDPHSKNFLEYEYYDIYPPEGVGFVVHRDRLHILDGAEISNQDRVTNRYWGDSVLQAPYDQLRAMGNVYSNVESIIEDFVQTILTIENLQQLIASGQEELVKRRIEIIEMARNVINMILLDSNEKYTKETSRVSGIEKLMQQFAIALSAVSYIPVTLLMGQSPAGMDATGESDVRAFYDRIASLQDEKALPVIDWVNKFIVNASEYKIGIKEPIVEFCPLWQPTQAEIINTRKVQAEVDEIYINSGVTSGQEVRDSRFGGEVYSYETTVEGELESDFRSPEEDEEE